MIMIASFPLYLFTKYATQKFALESRVLPKMIADSPELSESNAELPKKKIKRQGEREFSPKE